VRGRQKKGWKPFSPKNNLIQDSEQKEENRYPIPDFNKTKIIYAKEPNEAYKNTMKQEILRVITENFMEMILDMVKQNVQEAVKKIPRHQK
jgi:hypothetical protein